jgi:RHS repeat-associated protein
MDENGTQTWTLYDGSDPVMDFNSSGSLEMRYLNGPTGDLVDTIIARESAGGTVAWYLPDRLGTIRDLINNLGSIIDHVDYSAFGTVLDESSPSNGDRMMGFAGMERDTVTGLNLAVNRVQNPGTGRWTSPDPLGFAGGDAELYRYVGNSPVEQLDPIGTDPHYDGGNITSWDRTYLRLQYLYIRSALQGLQKRAMTDEQRSTVRFWQSLFENAKVCKVEYMDSDDLAGTNKYTNVIHFGRKHFQLSLEGQLVS